MAAGSTRPEFGTSFQELVWGGKANALVLAAEPAPTKAALTAGVAQFNTLGIILNRP